MKCKVAKVNVILRVKAIRWLIDFLTILIEHVLKCDWNCLPERLASAHPQLWGRQEDEGDGTPFSQLPPIPEEVDKARRAHNAIGSRSHIKALHVCPVTMTPSRHSIECVSLAFSESFVQNLDTTQQ